MLGAVGAFQRLCSQMSLQQEKARSRTARTGASPHSQGPGGVPPARAGSIPVPELAPAAPCADPGRWQQGLRVGSTALLSPVLNARKATADTSQDKLNSEKNIAWIRWVSHLSR